MREHTITKIRDMLSSQDRDVVSSLKANEQHKYRTLSEALPTKETAKEAVRKLFSGGGSSTSEKAGVFSRRNLEAAARREGITNMAAVRKISDVLVQNPQAILNNVFWRDIGRGVASALLHGTFDPNYSIPEVGGALSHKASSFERIGGKLGTGAYKAGRALQRAEKWFNVDDPDAERRYAADSAFRPHGRQGAIDKCVKQRVTSADGETSYVGHEFGTIGYEKCISNPNEQEQISILSDDKYAMSILPKLLRQIGISPEEYMKSQRREQEYRAGRYARKRHKYTGL